MDDQTAQLAATTAVVAAAAVAVGKFVGPTQTQIVQWWIDAFRVPSQWRGLLNLAVGLGLALALGVLAGWRSGDWGLVPIAAVAGVFSSVEAARVHDAAKTD